MRTWYPVIDTVRSQQEEQIAMTHDATNKKIFRKMRRRGGVGLVAMGVAVVPAQPLPSFLKVQVLSLWFQFHKMGVFWSSNYHGGSWKGRQNILRSPFSAAPTWEFPVFLLLGLAQGEPPGAGLVLGVHEWRTGVLIEKSNDLSSLQFSHIKPHWRPERTLMRQHSENGWETKLKRKACNYGLTSFWVSFSS